MREMTSDNILKQQKARAQRIDHDYHARPHPWRTWMRILSIALPLLGAATVAVLSFGTYGATLYEPGPVSTRHSMFNHKCEDCHEKSGGQFGVVTNAKCQVCHDGPLHNHRQVFNGPDKLKKIIERKVATGSNATEEVEVEANTPRCASCHTEHKGNKSLLTMSDSHCTQCHLDLKVNDKDKPIFKSGIASFMQGHPEWKALRKEEGDPKVGGNDLTPIKFNHLAHMNPKKVHYKEESGKGERGVRCDDCHKADDQNRYMQPIKYDAHCAECHTLKEVAGIRPPHAKAVEIRAAVKAGMLSSLPDNKFPMNKQIAEMAADLLEKNGASKSELKQVDAAIKSGTLTGAMKNAKVPDARHDQEKLTVEFMLKKDLFVIPDSEERAQDGTCMFCHMPNTKIESNLVLEPNIPTRWLKHSFFNHQTHRVINCDSCHAQAATSKATTDVLLPGIESCQKCHKPGAAQTGCNECHNYHDKSHQMQNGTVSIEGLLSKGAGAATGTTPPAKPK